MAEPREKDLGRDRDGQSAVAEEPRNFLSLSEDEKLAVIERSVLRLQLGGFIVGGPAPKKNDDID